METDKIGADEAEPELDAVLLAQHGAPHQPPRLDVLQRDALRRSAGSPFAAVSRYGSDGTAREAGKVGTALPPKLPLSRAAKLEADSAVDLSCDHRQQPTTITGRGRRSRRSSLLSMLEPDALWTGDDLRALQLTADPSEGAEEEKEQDANSVPSSSNTILRPKATPLLAAVKTADISSTLSTLNWNRCASPTPLENENDNATTRRAVSSHTKTALGARKQPLRSSGLRSTGNCRPHNPVTALPAPAKFVRAARMTIADTCSPEGRLHVCQPTAQRPDGDRHKMDAGGDVADVDSACDASDMEMDQLDACRRSSGSVAGGRKDQSTLQAQSGDGLVPTMAVEMAAPTTTRTGKRFRDRSTGRRHHYRHHRPAHHSTHSQPRRPERPFYIPTIVEASSPRASLPAVFDSAASSCTSMQVQPAYSSAASVSTLSSQTTSQASSPLLRTSSTFSDGVLGSPMPYKVAKVSGGPAACADNYEVSPLAAAGSYVASFLAGGLAAYAILRHTWRSGGAA
jgi:hypothetical protein